MSVIKSLIAIGGNVVTSENSVVTCSVPFVIDAKIAFYLVFYVPVQHEGFIMLSDVVFYMETKDGDTDMRLTPDSDEFDLGNFCLTNIPDRFISTNDLFMGLLFTCFLCLL